MKCEICGKKISIMDWGVSLYNGKPSAWIFSIFTGYKQLGVFDVEKGHGFKEGDNVAVIKKDGKVTRVYRKRINNLSKSLSE